MTPEELRQFNIVNSFGKPNELWGVPIEIDPNTTGVMIAVDGTEMPLVEGYRRKPRAKANNSHSRRCLLLRVAKPKYALGSWWQQFQ